MIRNHPRLALLCCFVLTFLATGGGVKLETAHGQELTPGLEKIDSQFATVEAEIDRVQSGYILTTGRYLQTLTTNPTTPDKPTLQNYLQSPSDVGISLSDLGATLPATLDIRFEVHEYMGPSGPGYRIIAYAIVDGQEYRKITHRGPEPGLRSTDWEPYVPDKE